MIDIDSGFGYSKRAQEPGRNGESCSIETPSFVLSRHRALSSTPWQDRKSPLLLAVEKQLFEIVQALIAAGADVDASDKVSST